MKRWPSFLQHDHSPETIAHRLSHPRGRGAIRDFVYGAIDGTVTTFSIVAGVTGADLTVSVILILGVSNVISDGFSMASGNFLATKAELDERELLSKFESEQIDLNPSGEKEEVRQIFKTMGFEGDLLHKAVEKISKDRVKWLRLMISEEYGLSLSPLSPLRAAVITFLAFLLFGFIPLLPFALGANDEFMSSTVMTGFAFLLLGGLKSLWSLEKAWVSALKTFFIGSMAAGLAYAVGLLLKDLA